MWCAIVRADTSEYSFPFAGQRSFFGSVLSRLDEGRQLLMTYPAIAYLEKIIRRFAQDTKEKVRLWVISAG